MLIEWEADELKAHRRTPHTTVHTGLVYSGSLRYRAIIILVNICLKY